MFTVDKDGDGNYFLSTREGDVISFKTEQALITGIRKYLGMPSIGRPSKKIEEGVDKVAV